MVNELFLQQPPVEYPCYTFLNVWNFLDLDIDKYWWPSKIGITGNCAEYFQLLPKCGLCMDFHCIMVKYFLPSQTSKESAKFNNSIHASFLRTESPESGYGPNLN